MNSTTTTTARHPPRSVEPTRRVALVDRAALHLGVALIAWGRRGGLNPIGRERRATRWEAHLARLARDEDALRRLLLEQPRR